MSNSGIALFCLSHDLVIWYISPRKKSDNLKENILTVKNNRTFYLLFMNNNQFRTCYGLADETGSIIFNAIQNIISISMENGVTARSVRCARAGGRTVITNVVRPIYIFIFCSPIRRSAFSQLIFANIISLMSFGFCRVVRHIYIINSVISQSGLTYCSLTVGPLLYKHLSEIVNNIKYTTKKPSK